MGEVERKLAQAMFEPDRWVARIEYEARDGTVTRRVISPCGFRYPNHVLALCLGREEPRTFIVDQVRSVHLVRASAVLMPEAVEEVEL